jgi:hypothetical protein
MPLKLKIISAVISLFAIFGCHTDKAEVTKIQELIQQNLKPGDSDTKIVEFLKQNGFTYSFFDYMNRYECLVPKSENTDWKGVRGVIQMYIYVKADRTFNRAEVTMVYTYL